MILSIVTKDEQIVSALNLAWKYLTIFLQNNSLL